MAINKTQGPFGASSIPGMSKPNPSPKSNLPIPNPAPDWKGEEDPDIKAAVDQIEVQCKLSRKALVPAHIMSSYINKVENRAIIVQKIVLYHKCSTAIANGILNREIKAFEAAIANQNMRDKCAICRLVNYSVTITKADGVGLQKLCHSCAESLRQDGVIEPEIDYSSFTNNQWLHLFNLTNTIPCFSPAYPAAVDKFIAFMEEKCHNLS